MARPKSSRNRTVEDWEDLIAEVLHDEAGRQIFEQYVMHERWQQEQYWRDLELSICYRRPGAGGTSYAAALAGIKRLRTETLRHRYQSAQWAQAQHEAYILFICVRRNQPPPSSLDIFTEPGLPSAHGLAVRGIQYHHQVELMAFEEELAETQSYHERMASRYRDIRREILRTLIRRKVKIEKALDSSEWVPAEEKSMRRLLSDLIVI